MAKITLRVNGKAQTVDVRLPKPKPKKKPKCKRPKAECDDVFECQGKRVKDDCRRPPRPEPES